MKLQIEVWINTNLFFVIDQTFFFVLQLLTNRSTHICKSYVDVRFNSMLQISKLNFLNFNFEQMKFKLWNYKNKICVINKKCFVEIIIDNFVFVITQTFFVLLFLTNHSTYIYNSHVDVCFNSMIQISKLKFCKMFFEK